MRRPEENYILPLGAGESKCSDDNRKRVNYSYQTWYELAWKCVSDPISPTSVHRTSGPSACQLDLGFRFSKDRTAASTVWPAPDKALQIACPTKPLTPVTRTFVIVQTFPPVTKNYKSIKRLKYRGQKQISYQVCKDVKNSNLFEFFTKGQ